ncbi:MAG TPA: beta-ketoacyl-ACP synthase III [Kofleriaceae bacterium]|jgi:beta-ketodecanoyl-[acyl-carrier-protein] synthase|nr:beta-ketoacyl-ACP synthase III [Kofleriaceae bacterium]
MPRISTGTAITGHAVWHPETVLTNDELVAAFNEFVRRDNAKHADEIGAGKRQPLKESSSEFIVKASGIKSRYVEDKTGLTDPDRMCPNIADRPEEALSIQAEYSINAAKQALARAGKTGADIDLVVLGACNLQRMYPSLAIEVQEAIGARGWAYDVSLGCSAATCATITATHAIMSGSANSALIVVPELTTGHMNWRDRDSHFIFGDASVALVLEKVENAKPGSWEILSTKMQSKWSATAIRNNLGFLDRCDPVTKDTDTKLFHQQGRKVFKDVVPLASAFIKEQLEQYGLAPNQVGRFWLHQANQKLNEVVAEWVIGHTPSREEAPIILDEYGNTASAGSLIAFSLHNEDLAKGTYGLMCSFGAGYSLGGLLMQRI